MDSQQQQQQQRQQQQPQVSCQGSSSGSADSGNQPQQQSPPSQIPQYLLAGSADNPAQWQQQPTLQLPVFQPSALQQLQQQLVSVGDSIGTNNAAFAQLSALLTSFAAGGFGGAQQQQQPLQQFQQQRQANFMSQPQQSQQQQQQPQGLINMNQLHQQHQNQFLLAQQLLQGGGSIPNLGGGSMMGNFNLLSNAMDQQGGVGVTAASGNGNLGGLGFAGATWPQIAAAVGALSSGQQFPAYVSSSAANVSGSGDNVNNGMSSITNSDTKGNNSNKGVVAAALKGTKSDEIEWGKYEFGNHDDFFSLARFNSHIYLYFHLLEIFNVIQQSHLPEKERKNRASRPSCTRYHHFPALKTTIEVATLYTFSQIYSQFPIFDSCHQILSNPEFQEYICWNPHGRSWRILKPPVFEQVVIPLYFRHGKYASFMRQVNGWGFKRIVSKLRHS